MRYLGLSCQSEAPIAVDIEENKIVSVRPTALRPGMPWLCPGFTDIQVNGYAGLDYSSPNLSVDEVETICATIASSGTLRHCATIITSPRENINRSCKVIATAVREKNLVAASVIGIHIEGPFISPEDGPRGAHDPAHVRLPSFGEFLEWQENAGGLIKIVTIAPEMEGALDFIAKASAAGVVVAIGHTGASPEIIRQAVAAGARVSTHLGNGSHANLPRLKNYLWEQLAADELSASIIADGFHLPNAVIKAFSRAKGLSKLILVSDVAFLAGSEPGLKRWGNMNVEVHPDGHIGLAGTPFLAGAGHLLDRCIAQFVRATGATVPETVSLCTTNPALLLGLPDSACELEAGSPANLVSFHLSDGANSLRVEHSLLLGEETASHGA